MQTGRGGMGTRKHGKCGIHVKAGGKSPRFRHWQKREAEKQEWKDNSRIHNPKNSVRELLGGEAK